MNPSFDIVSVEQMIYTIRDTYVMIDRDLADLYGVETKVLNQAVKRNGYRFPESFRFRLSKQETYELVTNCDRFNTLKHSSAFPYAFTEHGVIMAAAVLKTEIANKVSVTIVKAFVSMRHFFILYAFGNILDILPKISYLCQCVWNTSASYHPKCRLSRSNLLLTSRE